MFGALGLLVMHLAARHGARPASGRLTPVAPGALASSCCSWCSSSAPSVNGASRWIGAGSFQIQPSEIAKVALVLYGADLLAERAEAGAVDRAA